ncbi:MAG: ABC transporter substrate binding protein [Desulfobacteraceae bacterium]|nr:ABC transporter substrate binding protein [Desulfobacteraceae bacterium]
MLRRPTHFAALLLLFFQLFALLPVCPPVAAAQEQKHVLVLNSYHQGYAWTDQIVKGIQQGFAASDLPVELSYEYLDAQHHDPATLYPLLEKLYRLKFTDHRQPFDAVIVADNDAFEFFLSRRHIIAPGVPVVFCGVNDFHPEMLANQKNITGVAEDIDLRPTIETALRLHSHARHLAVVSDITTTGRINHQHFLQVMPAFAKRLDLIDLAGLPAAELERRLAALPPDTIILYLDYYRDPTGRVFSPEEGMALILAHAKAPVYTLWGFAVRSGALGGIVVSGILQGETAARMAIRILGGEPAGAIPVVTESPNVPMFNYDQLKRFDISRASLPGGSVIVNEPQTFYYRYKGLIYAALLVLLLQAAIIFALAVNITRRKRAEAGLRESEARFRGYFELGLIGTAVGNSEGRWIAVNDRLCRMLGYTREELLSMPWTELTASDDLPRNAELFARMLAGEIDEYTMAKRFLRKDGKPVDAEIAVRGVRKPDGSLDYSLAHVQDVTARRQAERKLAEYQGHLEELVQERTRALAAANERLHQEVLDRQQAEQSLRESEEKHRSLVERATDGIFILQGNVFKYVNPALAELLGSTRDELLGLPVDRILPPELCEALRDRYQRQVAGETAGSKYEIQLTRKGGDTIDAEFNAGLVPYEGKPASLVFVRDIRERKQLEEERAKVGKLESIGILAGGIAHDFNNLLTGVLGNVSFARFLVEAGSKAEGLLANAEKISLRARELSNRLITFAEGGEPVKTRVDLPELLPEAVDFALSGSSIASGLSLAPGLRPVEADPAQLRQLIGILVQNSREAMPDGGQIEIAAENVAIPPGGQLNPGRYVRLAVTDHGRGIAPEHLPRIFDPYFSTKEMGPKKGTGLGLAIAYSIVRRHGGHIEVQSEMNRGTTVIIHLPAGRRAEIQSLADLAESRPGEGKKVLLLEDEPAVREIAGDILQFLGYKVESAATGEQALSLYRRAMRNGRPFDAVVLDLTVRGGLGGAATMEELRRADPGVRAVVASGFANEPVLADYRLYGFKAAITKPYQLQELNDALEKAMGKAMDNE